MVISASLVYVCLNFKDVSNEIKTNYFDKFSLKK